MNGHYYLLIGLIVLGTLCACQQKQGESSVAKMNVPVLETGSQQPMPDAWIDQDTKHKIIKLSRREGGGSSFYFHNNPFLKQLDNEGDKMVFYGKVDSLRQLFSINLSTFNIVQLTYHRNQIRGEIVSPANREAYFQSNDSIFATHVDTKQTRLVYVFPEDFKAGITTINSDGTLLAGSYATQEKRDIYKKNPEKRDYFNLIFEAKIPHILFTVNIETGELKKIYSESAWLNHIQFSPTEPDLLMYCHEGPWHLLDRIWTINIHTGINKLMHERTIDREIAGHEFFSKDGKTIWYDLQKPRGETFYLAGVDIATGEHVEYAMTADEWSIHFNISPDQSIFAGDGGDSTQVARAKNGQWIYLFTPTSDSLISEKLVNMKHHGYRPLEPNVHFSPDGKYVIFRSDFDGDTHIYAVEI